MQERGRQQGRRQDDRDREQAGQGRRSGQGGQGRQGDTGRQGGQGGVGRQGGKGGGERDVNRPNPMGRREENPQRAPRQDEENLDIDRDEEGGLGEEGTTRRGDRDTQYWPKRHEGGERKERDPFASD